MCVAQTFNVVVQVLGVCVAQTLGVCHTQVVCVAQRFHVVVQVLPRPSWHTLQRSPGVAHWTRGGGNEWWAVGRLPLLVHPPPHVAHWTHGGGNEWWAVGRLPLLVHQGGVAARLGGVTTRLKAPRPPCAQDPLVTKAPLRPRASRHQGPLVHKGGVTARLGGPDAER